MIKLSDEIDGPVCWLNPRYGQAYTRTEFDRAHTIIAVSESSRRRLEQHKLGADLVINPVVTMVTPPIDTSRFVSPSAEHTSPDKRVFTAIAKEELGLDPDKPLVLQLGSGNVITAANDDVPYHVMTVSAVTPAIMRSADVFLIDYHPHDWDDRVAHALACECLLVATKDGANNDIFAEHARVDESPDAVMQAYNDRDYRAQIRIAALQLFRRAPAYLAQWRAQYGHYLALE